MRKERRIGLVLGAGGVLGGAWLAGALSGLRATTGWEPGAAHVLLGTSAGSVFTAGLGAPAGLLGRGLRLRHRRARGVRAGPGAEAAAGVGRGRVVRRPRHLLPGPGGRPAVRRRRPALAVQPGRPGRPAPGPGGGA